MFAHFGPKRTEASGRYSIPDVSTKVLLDQQNDFNLSASKIGVVMFQKLFSQQIQKTTQAGQHVLTGGLEDLKLSFLLVKKRLPDKHLW